MNKYAVLFLAFIFIGCEKKKTETSQTKDQSEIIAEKNHEIDSLQKVISGQNSDNPVESGNTNPDPQDPVYGNQENGTENPDNTKLTDLSGKHGITLHWLSWDKPGTVNFRKTGADTYSVSGKQSIKGEYVTIEGKMKQVSEKELQFEGTVITFNDLDGKCVKTGPQIFLSTKGRKYWRMQNMENCNGAVDYVDIYF